MLPVYTFCKFKTCSISTSRMALLFFSWLGTVLLFQCLWYIQAVVPLHISRIGLWVQHEAGKITALYNNNCISSVTFSVSVNRIPLISGIQKKAISTQVRMKNLHALCDMYFYSTACLAMQVGHVLCCTSKAPLSCWTVGWMLPLYCTSCLCHSSRGMSLTQAHQENAVLY